MRYHCLLSNNNVVKLPWKWSRQGSNISMMKQRSSRHNCVRLMRNDVLYDVKFSHSSTHLPCGIITIGWKKKNSNLKENCHRCDDPLLPKCSTEAVKVIWVVHVDLHLSESTKQKNPQKNLLVSIQYFGKCWHTVFAFLTNSYLESSHVNSVYCQVFFPKTSQMEEEKYERNWLGNPHSLELLLRLNIMRDLLPSAVWICAVQHWDLLNSNVFHNWRREHDVRKIWLICR